MGRDTHISGISILIHWMVFGAILSFLRQPVFYNALSCSCLHHATAWASNVIVYRLSVRNVVSSEHWSYKFGYLEFYCTNN